MATPVRRPATGAPAAALRDATLKDIPALLTLEERSFAGDRLSRRSFHHLLTKGRAITLVAERDGRIVGYAMAFLHGRTSLARLYSIAVDADARGIGIGRQLLQEAERRAVADARAVMRLEVRADDAAVIAMYVRAGYREIGRVRDYYEDGCDALRMEKVLVGGDRPELRRVPFYGQTLEFTCGSASLMMAMKAIEPALALNRTLELRIWREATLVFMTKGHGGCGPFGLALAATRRGFDCELFVNARGPLFLDTVRSAEKKEVMRLVQEDFRRQISDAGVPVHYAALSSASLSDWLDAGAVPVVLISSYRLYGEKEPHWVTLTGQDEHFFYLHDPFIYEERYKSATDAMNVPVSRREFDRMARFGRAGLRAAIILKGRRP